MLILANGEAKYFLRKGWTGICNRCPSGKSGRWVELFAKAIIFAAAIDGHRFAPPIALVRHAALSCGPDLEEYIEGPKKGLFFASVPVHFSGENPVLLADDE